jgi:hypothetical protein
MGGLGNNLFQLAAVYNLAKKYNKKYFLNESVDRTNLKSHYKQSRELEIKQLFENDFTFANLNIDMVYNHLDLNPNYNSRFSQLPDFEKNTCYVGYFQSPLYHDSFDPKKEFTLNRQIRKRILENHKQLFSKPTISMHYRLGGDRISKKIQMYHQNLTHKYYKNSLDICLKKINLKREQVNVLLFSDLIDIATSHLKKHGIDTIPIKTGNNIEDFIFMSMCDHNIIGNSSYSWWSAYLNNNDNKVVTASKEKWYGPKYSHFDLTDLFPSQWILL